MEQNLYEAFESRYNIKKLTKNEKIDYFDCGDADLNEFLIEESLLYLNEKLAISYIIENKENPKDILAFFSLSNDKISVSDFENKTTYNRFSKRFNNRKRLKSYPAVKIARLGVSQATKGRNIGTFILKYVKSYFSLDNKSGCRFITVDAYSDAIPFYTKNGFIPLNNDDLHDKTRLLYFDLNDVSN